MPDLVNYQTYRLEIKSADERPREASPKDWFPTVAAQVVNEDELELLPPGVWFRYFHGGHNGLHYVMQDDDGCFYYLDGAFGRYELTGPNVGGDYHNAYDAFWTAEQEAGLVHSDTPQQPS